LAEPVPTPSPVSVSEVMLEGLQRRLSSATASAGAARRSATVKAASFAISA
jgi:hypothetical protein